ncbi:MAG: DUF1998 domain-containing protein [Synergistaceae bacterium]|jgi:hypothetical protein|nr:DUF1998 domain-containing protein [Synergistaceae bacterium]
MARRFGNKQNPEHAGEVRQSQLISTFGIGSIVDFVRDTVMIAGVDNWDSTEDWEERKLFNNNLQAITAAEHFLAPKTAANKLYHKSHDIESFIFPRKLYCPICKHIVDARELGNQQKKHNCFMPSASKPGKPCGGHLVASRFIIVCQNGHIEDFPYSWWAHHGGNCAKSGSPRIVMYNVDDRSDIDSLMIKCEDCGAKRGMAPAFAPNAFAGEAGYRCRGKHPHLGHDFTSECAEIMTARMRTSSSVYFPAALSTLTIPPWSRKAVQIIEAEYDELADREQYGEQAVLDYIKRKVSSKAKNQIPFSDLMSAYALVKEQKKSSKIYSEADILAAEYDVLCGGAIQSDEYAASAAHVPSGFEKIFESVTVVDKLTVINALVGFTRINPWDGALAGNSRLAPLSREKKNWLPAVKLLGEGIFFRFNQAALSAWELLAGKRYHEMTAQLSESFLKNDMFSPKYVALHTFAHLLVRQLADDCGYSASSIKEKIYSTFADEPNRPDMSGVLVYLATSDAEGSLGGLISIAADPNRMQSVLKNMLHKAQWCSADPLCCNSTKQGFHSLNYAACHDCVLLPETSCEFRNTLLDRAAIVGTPENPRLGLMGEIMASL